MCTCRMAELTAAQIDSFAGQRLGRAEAIPIGGAGLGPEFNGAFIRIHPEQVNSFGLA